LHRDVSRSGRASVQLNGYRIGWAWKNLAEILMPEIQNHAPAIILRASLLGPPKHKI